MEYNKLIRIYYEKMYEIFDGVDFHPEIVFTIDDENFMIPKRYFDENSQGNPFLGIGKIKLGSPNIAYEKYFEVMGKSYPELSMIFLPKENFLKLAKQIQEPQQIITYLQATYIMYMNAGFITSINSNNEV